MGITDSVCNAPELSDFGLHICREQHSKVLTVPWTVLGFRVPWTVESLGIKRLLIFYGLPQHNPKQEPSLP